jgi:hypothetical protein
MPVEALSTVLPVMLTSSLAMVLSPTVRLVTKMPAPPMPLPPLVPIRLLLTVTLGLP